MKNTHLDLTTLLLMAIQDEEIPVQNEFCDSDFAIDRVITEQQRIGWHLVKYGFIKKEWTRVQE